MLQMQNNCLHDLEAFIFLRKYRKIFSGKASFEKLCKGLCSPLQDLRPFEVEGDSSIYLDDISATQNW
jgi:hypothetical protein